MAAALDKGARTPCSDDQRLTGRDWTAENITREDAEEMAALCGQCPFIKDCFRRALAQQPGTHGVWAGTLWRDGFPVNLKEDAPKRRSAYPGVIWDSSRSKWKAFGQIPKTESEPRRHFHLGYFDDERRAALVARCWRIDHDQAP